MTTKEDSDLEDLPESVTVKIDLKQGAAYFYLNSETENEFTIPDCGEPNINIDINDKGEVYGVEDISKELGDVVKRWLSAIKAAKNHKGVQNLREKHGRK